MPLLRSASGTIRPMATLAGVPLLNSPSSVAAPPLVVAPSEQLFAMQSARPGVPGINDQFEFLGVSRDWPLNFASTTEGFAGIRWQPTWMAIEGFYGQWEPAEGNVYRVQRKGTTGQDAQTLVFTCGPNTATIPVGDKVVIYHAIGDGEPERTNSFNLAGYNMPTRTKMTVTACTPSAANDVNGRRIIEVDAGTALPAIDYTTTTFAGQYADKTNLALRHWSFYANSATNQLRHPLGWFHDITVNSIIANGGYCILGGLQFAPTWNDWTRQYNAFGASLTEELFRLECEGLAYHFGNTDPKKLAVDLMNAPNSSWAASGGDAGYGQLLQDVFYPTARTAWGAARTLIVKPAGYGGMNSLLSEFNFTCPAGDNAHLAVANFDGQITWPNGTINFSAIDQTNWMADQLKQKIVSLGFAGGGMTAVGVAPHEIWDNSVLVADDERGRRLGRVLTSMTGQGLYAFAWGHCGDYYNVAGVRTVDGKNIEAYNTGLAPYARRSGITVT